MFNTDRNIKLQKHITKRKKDVNPKYQCKPNLRKHEAAAGWSVDPGLGEVTVIINVWRCVIINRLNLPGVPLVIDFYFSVLWIYLFRHNPDNTDLIPWELSLCTHGHLEYTANAKILHVENSKLWHIKIFFSILVIVLSISRIWKTPGGHGWWLPILYEYSMTTNRFHVEVHQSGSSLHWHWSCQVFPKFSAQMNQIQMIRCLQLNVDGTAFVQELCIILWQTLQFSCCFHLF